MKSKLLFFLLIYVFAGCQGQRRFGIDNLKMEKVIDLPGVRGRIDHMAVNLKDQVVYIAALENNSIEIVDLNKGAVIHSIHQVKEPQGIAYIPQQNEIAVASGGNGDCIFFNVASFEKVAVVHLADDADNIRYDSVERKIYVGYGSGGIALIDAVNHQQLNDIKLPAHPESFQLDKKHNRLYVNLPDDNSIAVIDLNTFKVTGSWKTGNLKANFPMCLDTLNSQLFVGYRHPALLVYYDINTGKELGKAGLIRDADDIFYLQNTQQLIASGGAGAINIFSRDSASGIKKIADIPASNGARTSLFIPSLQLYVLAERATINTRAAIVLFRIKNPG